MARLGKSGAEKKKEEKENRDGSKIVSAYSKEGQLRKKETQEAGRLKGWEKALMVLGYVLMFVLALLVIYFLEQAGIF